MKNEYEELLTQYVSQINHALEEYLPQDTGGYDLVRQAMRYSVGAGGKRIRPVLVLHFAKLCGALPEKALPFACAVEFIHTYSLIHDDLPCMDDDALRRGKPSCHVKFGEAAALLAGDALLTLAFELLGKAPSLTGVSERASAKAVLSLASYSGISGMVGGQVMDLSNEEKPVDCETFLLTCQKKTSALLSAACQLGVLAAEGPDELENAAREYGCYLGIAFQIVDDILDVTGEEKKLGKPIGSDADNQKVTAVSLCGLKGAEDMAAEYTQKALQSAAVLPDQGFLSGLTEQLLNRKF